MKNRARGILSLCLVGALLLSACGKSDDTDTLSNSEESSSTTSQVPEKLIGPEGKEIKEITAADFKKGVFIDFDQYKQSFFNDDIISKFKGNIEAVVKKDKEKFKENLSEDSRGETFFFSEEDVQFMFYDLDTLEKHTINGREEIQVGVRFARKYSDGSIENQGITYFFTKNKEGKWDIENID
ncbi:hypothetical protein J7E73_14875 [Paenibacillus albidus]|uniref:hypothetical protein n=1 Tax=Paenibacillus albidus TaxID=2041023 RepID=UPI001BEB42D4|nr:hypothetical protein [Paenibacillus albidus]MBT2290402.1 hypothetical protein [Paenibacillus albidus]